MFLHSLKYAFKTLFKSRALMFWTLVFPFALAIMFNMAFARLHDEEVFEAIDIAVVDDAAFRDEEVFKEAFETLSKEGDDQLFKTQYVEKAHAEELLDNKEIAGYVYFVDGEPHVKIKENGTNQTVLTTAVEQISQSATMLEDIVPKLVEDEVTEKMTKNPTEMPDIEKITDEVVESVTNVEPNIKNDSRTSNIVAIEFYTLIAMACMQGAMLSTELTDRNLPNISNRGKRIAVAPTHKSVVLASNLLAGYTILLVGLLGLIAFMRFVLGVEFGSDLRLIVALAAAGALAATMLGMFLSIVLKTNSGAKNVIVLVVTMVGSLFAGMFGGQKNFFDDVAPLINKISPVGLITDGYYALYYSEDMTRFWVNLGSLLAIAAILFVFSIRGLRRQRYDSI